MDIKWYQPSLGVPTVTIASYGISFNKAAIAELNDSPYIRLGYVKKERLIVVQALDEKQEEALTFSERKRDGYIRINNKDLVKFITRYFDINLERAIRIDAFWDDELNVLIIDLNKAETDEDGSNNDDTNGDEE